MNKLLIYLIIFLIGILCLYFLEVFQDKEGFRSRDNNRSIRGHRSSRSSRGSRPSRSSRGSRTYKTTKYIYPERNVYVSPTVDSWSWWRWKYPLWGWSPFYDPWYYNGYYDYDGYESVYY